MSEEVLKKLHEWYIYQHIKPLTNKVDKLYKEEDFFAAWGLSLIIDRLFKL